MRYLITRVMVLFMKTPTSKPARSSRRPVAKRPTEAEQYRTMTLASLQDTTPRPVPATTVLTLAEMMAEAKARLSSSC